MLRKKDESTWLSLFIKCRSSRRSSCLSVFLSLELLIDQAWSHHQPRVFSSVDDDGCFWLLLSVVLGFWWPFARLLLLLFSLLFVAGTDNRRAVRLNTPACE